MEHKDERNTGMKPDIYNGYQLRNLFVYEMTGTVGDGSFAWISECVVPLSLMVDAADTVMISCDRMLHIVIELFNRPFSEVVMAQRLLIMKLAEEINLELMSYGDPMYVCRDGDDLYVRSWIGDDNRGKLSVSIAAPTINSGVIHLGLNLTVTGIPGEVTAASLTDVIMEEDILTLVGHWMAEFWEELDNIRDASCKVYPAHPASRPDLDKVRA